jgi:hypothetical protein
MTMLFLVALILLLLHKSYTFLSFDNPQSSIFKDTKTPVFLTFDNNSFNKNGKTIFRKPNNLVRQKAG